MNLEDFSFTLNEWNERIDVPRTGKFVPLHAVDSIISDYVKRMESLKENEAERMALLRKKIDEKKWDSEAYSDHFVDGMIEALRVVNEVFGKEGAKKK